MDYCSSCRRHLNGALVCPGCGAYAPDIAPPAASAVTVRPVREAGSADAWYHGGLPDEPAAAAPDEAPSDEVTGAPPAQRGRAARRRQLARWKKNKRRAAVATAVALVGGGLTLAALDRQSPDRAQAASAPDNRPMGATDGQATGDARPEPTPPGTHRSPHTAAPAHAQAPAAGAPHRHTLAAAPRTTTPDTHPDSAAAPVPAQTPAAPHRHTTAPVSGNTGTGTTAQQPSAPPATPAPAPSAGGGTDQGTSPASPSPAATSPSQLCLVLVCLG
ncbi:hypothetical protein J2Z21_005777 [Streptomyces griseochromogenes]|uniref:Uncharacterized protein n=1 Tax=Streptomyces griseochromogenes TaxID=68214 RepID=A0A1B1APP1_9ACTN|nr:hypothetical protein [Streptomyces griseochromogenes]ANP48531.1 hypothetical protein AVL59_02140 [Streptomyces griseochromogenes]MBP2052788.1 hypothetical protein [Streptomyces griseochromogenes]